jgi:internalin A
VGAALVMQLEEQLRECRERNLLLHEREEYLVKTLRELVGTFVYQEEPRRSQVFISYSRKDIRWLARLKLVLLPVIKGNAIKIFDDTMINVGDKWKDIIRAALKNTKVAVLMVSPEFLGSEFVCNNELPTILDSERAKALRIIWFPIRHSLVEDTPIIAYQAALDASRPLSSMKRADQDMALVRIAKVIEKEYRS